MRPKPTYDPFNLNRIYTKQNTRTKLSTEEGETRR